MSNFSTPQEVYEIFAARAEQRSWPIGTTELAALYKLLNAEPQVAGNSGSAITLDLWLGDWQYTLRELERWVKDTIPYCTGTLLSDQRLYPRRSSYNRHNGKAYVWPYGIRVAGTAQASFNPFRHAGIEAMVALCVHPGYPALIRSGTLNGIWFTGFDLDPRPSRRNDVHKAARLRRDGDDLKFEIVPALQSFALADVGHPESWRLGPAETLGAKLRRWSKS